MSGLKKKFTKRILAFTLTLAMAMSNMTVMASEVTPKEDSAITVSEGSSVENYNESGDETELVGDTDKSDDEESTEDVDASDDEKVTDDADKSDDDESSDDADEGTKSDEEGDDESSDSSDSEQADVTGTITWGGVDKVDPAADRSKLSIKFTSEEKGVSSVTAKITGNKYTASGLIVGETYTAEVKGIKDYYWSVDSEAEITVEESDNELDFTFEENERYNVTVKATGLSSKDLLEDVEFTFTDAEDSDYVYEFIGTKDIKLRDGEYKVELSEIDGYQVSDIDKLVVDGASATLNVEFVELSDAGISLLSAEDGVYVLEAKDLTQFGEGEKNGQSEVAGTDSYFTLLYGEKSKIDTSSKSWDDGYSSGVRINFGGKATTTANSVQFKTNASAEVKVWWAAGDTNRQITILNSSGTAVATTDGTWTKNDPYFSTLELEEAGTYYLGGDIGNNYIFKIEVTEIPSESVVNTLEAKDLTQFGEGEKNGQSEVAGTNDYFTLLYGEKSKIDTSSKSWDDGYSSGVRINFGGKATTTANSIQFKTNASAEVKVWWAAGDTNRQITILNSSGTAVATTDGTWTKNDPYLSTLELEEAGTYYLGGDIGNNYIFKVQVTEAGGTPKVRAPWEEVDAPEITEVKLNESNKNLIDVTVKMLIGNDGADRITVSMLDEAGEEEISSTNSSREGEEVTVSLQPSASGTYKFKVTATRNKEEDVKESAVSDGFAFVLPLTAPVIKTATSLGASKEDASLGSVEVEWNAVTEAEAYVVTALDGEEEAVAPIEVAAPNVKAVIDGLKVRDEEYTISVYAIRGEGENKGEGENRSEESTIKVKVTNDAKQKWGFSAYGASISISGSSPKDGYEGDANDGKVKVWSTGNGGKIVPASCGDGLAFYYTEVPTDTNFTLAADVTVDSWTYSNGQEGFGLMAADRVGVNGDSAALLNNSYMALVSKVEYFWDGEKVADSGDKYSMYLGVGSLARTGITPEGIASGESLPKGFNSDTYALDTSAATDGRKAGSYNIVGNSTNTPGGETIREYTTFRLIIQKNNTGYFVSYVDPETGRAVTKKYYDTSALSQIDSDTVYVGFFAARNATATFDNISFTTIAAEDDAPAEEQPISYVTPAYQVISSNVSNAEDYELVFTSNWNGELAIRDDMGNRVTEYVDRNGNVITDSNGNLKAEYKNADGSLFLETDENGTSYAYPIDIVNGTVKVTGTLDSATAADKIDIKIRAKVKLNIGANNFKVTFKPDKDWQPDEYTQLSTYDTSTSTFTVTYRKYGEEGKALYVSPTGTSSGTGTKDSPLDIYTAVKYVQAGQTILLADGEYKLTKTVTVDRGISGTADAMIYMIAENPSTDMYTSNVVFNFGGRCAGMILAGDYWYYSGFDVTNTADGQKGIQVSGSHCVFDQLKTYKNGNTGIQLSRYKGTDMTQAEWPSYNKVLNCTSYLNADSGYEDADGFAAKLTIGPGNVFDGCIAFYNADDGWDLFAKAENGPIGMVTIQNCVTFKNGYVLRDASGALSLDGSEVNAGNGNGFKMGGESISGHHTLKNSIAFFNKAKGFDSNSCPDIQVYNSITFNNESYNVAFYTNNANETDFIGQGVISYRKVSGSSDKLNVAEQLKPVGKQAADESQYKNETSYYWDTTTLTSKNTNNVEVADDWFVFITTDAKEAMGKITRNANGTINTNGFLVLTDKANDILKDAGVENGGLGEGEASDNEELEDKRDEGNITDGSVDKGDNDKSDGSNMEHPEDLFDENYSEEDLWTISVEPQTYTGYAIKPVVRVYRGESQLTEGTDYSISFKNNINASVKFNAESGSYEPIVDEAKLPTLTVKGKGQYEGYITRTFEIRPRDISKESGDVVASDITIVAANTNAVQKIKPAVTYNGRSLAQNRDYTINSNVSQASEGTPFKDFGDWNIELTGTGNYEGTNTITMHILNRNDANNVIISNAKATIPSDIKKNAIYTGEEWKPIISSITVGKATYSFKGNAETGIGDPDSPYSLEWYNNVNAGTASVVIVGNGGPIDGKYFVGTKTLTFTIRGGKLTAKDFEVYSNKFGDNETFDSIATREIPYEGQAIEFPKLAVRARNNATSNLKLGEDYTVTYKNNKRAGKASVIIKGINNYSGSITKTFKISAYNIERDPNGWVGGSYKEFNNGTRIVADYSQKGAAPSISLTINGKAQVLGTDYAVVYKNNKKVGNAATAEIRGKGALTGRLTVPFTISAMDISDPEANVTVDVNDVYYASSIKTGEKYQSRVILYDNGKVIPASTYDLTYTVKETGTILDGIHKLPDEFTNGNFSDDGYTVEVTIATNGRSVNYKGTITAEYRIAKYNLAKAKISTIDPKYYGYDTKIYTSDLNTIDYDENGQEYLAASKVTFSVAGQKTPVLLRCDKTDGDFYIDDTTFIGTGKVGAAKVTLRGVGKYGGTKVVSYRINKMSWDVKKAEVVSGASISEAISNQIIKGEAIDANTLKNKVKLNGAYLTYGKDYELSTDSRYAPKRKNNVAVTITNLDGTKTKVRKNVLTVTIVGKDSYGGINRNITFIIE